MSTRRSNKQAYSDDAVRAALRHHWHAATPEQRKDGRDWYKHALLAATNMAIQHGVPVHTAAGVIAALSPQHTWAQNLRLAEECLSGGTPKCFKRTANLAMYVRQQWMPEYVEAAIRGRKVTAFYANIIGDESWVTIDRWMLRAMGLPDKFSLTDKRYTQLGELVCDVARELNVTPAVLQATVWCVVRGKSF